MIGIPYGAYSAYKVQNIRAPTALVATTLMSAVPIVFAIGGVGMIAAIFNCLSTIPERMNYNNLKKHKVT
uniref:Uncharacterized protein n=1 Tax=Acrobeloides nanus TaxID=290746 RepID=A0A914DVD3_9BILA